MFTSSVCAKSSPESADLGRESTSKHVENRREISAVEDGISVSKTMLLNVAKESRTYKCSEEYACEGSAKAGKISCMINVNRS